MQLDNGEDERTERLSRLQSRCEAAGLESRIDEVRALDVRGSTEERPTRILALQVPAGRDTREIRFRENRLTELENSSFERWRFIEGYEAIWSSSLGAIECQLDGFGARRLAERVASLLPQRDGVPPENESRGDVESGDDAHERDAQTQVEFPSPDGLKILLGPGSSEHSLLCRSPFSVGSRATIRIEGLTGTQAERHDEARSVLERVGNAVLFQLDLALNSGVYLAEERRIGRAFRRVPPAEPILSKPAYEYDAEPMALYWYARSARGMPLVEYLANYQVMEFYFPTYATREARQIIRDRLKDPTFSPHRDPDLNRLLAEIRKTGAASRSLGDERSQLRATVTACVTADEIREFLEGDSELKAFFSSKQAYVTVAKQGIPLNNPGADLRNEIADRIYEIRCRIVHAKSGFESDVPPILPFSREARTLRNDLELIRFVVREAIIAASRPLQLKS